VAVTDLLAILYWPLAALTAVAFWRWLKRSGNNAWKRGWLIVAATLAAFAFAICLTLLGRRSAIEVLDWHILFVVLGCALLAPVALLAWLRLRSRIEKIPLPTVFLGLFGLAFFSFGLWQIAGDFVLPHERVEATVTGMKADMSRSGAHYHVYLNGKHHPTTAVVYDTLQVGDQIQASVSVTSGTIFGAKHVTRPPAIVDSVTAPR
jgi:hypothetical protein